MEKQAKQVTFSEAIHRYGNHYIMANNMPEVDQSIWDNFYKVIPEDEEIFQFYLSDCSDDDVKYLTKKYSRVYFTYSDQLDLWVLCVTHWGTSWTNVWVEER